MKTNGLRALAAIAAICLLSSCAAVLKPDPVLVSAVDANYPTAEFQACGRIWHGLGTCAVEEGAPSSAVNMQLQGYFEGGIVVDSVGCGISQKQTYRDNELVRVEFPKPISDDCILTFRISPELPSQDKNSQVVYPLKGHLLVKVLRKGDEVKLGTLKVTGRWQRTEKLWIGGTNEMVDVYLNGCGKNLRLKQELVNGYALVKLHDAVDYKIGTCVIDGVIVHPKYQDLRIDVLVAQYDERFTPLAIPTVSYDKDRIIVQADPAVSVITLDRQAINNSDASFKFDRSQAHILRLITVKGRSVIGEFDPEKGQWKWMQ
jgi:hypothetical protein